MVIFCFLLFANTLNAQNIYELRKLTDEDWIRMPTEERLTALGISNSHAQNQTFVGDFGMNYDLYPRWGYDYYEMEDRYENYAFRGFENYYIINDRRNRWYYNQFGDRLTKMRRDANIWTENFKDDGTSTVDRTSGYINSLMVVDGIWVARESTDDWAISAVGADALRVKLTPLTLSIPNMTGMKVDFQSANYSASFVNSIHTGDSDIAHRYFTSNKFKASVNSATLMVRGGQLRRKFGALSLGATYATMYVAQGTREKGSTLEGHIMDFAPTPMRYLIRIVDDSPYNAGGPIIHDVKLKVNGVYRPDIVPQVIIDDLSQELRTAVVSKNQKGYLERLQSHPAEKEPNESQNIYSRMPKFLDYMYFNSYVNGGNTDNVTKHLDVEKAKEYFRIIDPGGKPYQVNGNEYAVYIFDISGITDVVKSVKADVTVANDYRIQASKIFSTKPQGRIEAKGENSILYYDCTYWKTMAQAEGNITDGSNLRTVTIDFGYQVANIIYGFDAHFNYLGFKIDGEFVVNTQNFMFPDGRPGSGMPDYSATDISLRKGERYSRSDNAYYVIVQKEWQRFGFVGEYFKMGKFYTPEFQYFNHKDVSGNSNSRNNFEKMTLIEDNDDDDQYPDSMKNDQGMGSAIFTLIDPDGVFPGNDLDHDSIPDTDKNLNSLPDYDEPFLMLDVDPDEFVFGDDFNNNTIPDFRENDIKYDTPYDLDRQGRHINLRFTPQENIDIILGSLRQRGIGLNTRTDDDYLKLKINYDVATVGNIYAEYRYERIQDNIQDLYLMIRPKLQFAGASGVEARYDTDLYYDEIEYRNSKVNKLFLESRIRAIPSVTLENHVKYEMNSMIEGTMYDKVYQPEDIITTFAMANKLVYTRQWGNFTFSPGIKFRLYKKGYAESLNPRVHYTMRIPLLFLKYRVSSQTNVTLGFQGFEGFEFTYKDIVQSQNDYKQKNILLQIDNRTTYFGFDVWGGFGFMLEDLKFDEVYRSFENYKTSSFFVKLWLGFE
ncbi:hypothetical protein ACFL4V_01665 [Candidatus Latescibacterota bacterium]